MYNHLQLFCKHNSLDLTVRSPFVTRQGRKNQNVQQLVGQPLSIQSEARKLLTSIYLWFYLRSASQLNMKKTIQEETG